LSSDWAPRSNHQSIPGHYRFIAPDNVRLESKLERNYQLLGWALFIISAIGFIASSIRSGDILGLIGGIFFLLACFAFLVPLFRSNASGSREIEKPRTTRLLKTCKEP